MKFAKYVLLKNVFVIIFISVCNGQLVNITADVFSKPMHVLPSSFGDINFDKSTDVFSIGQGGKSVEALVPVEDKFSQKIVFRQETLVESHANDSEIVSVVPGDFDGDLQIDLIVVRKAGDTEVAVQIYWGNGQHKFIPDGQVISMSDQPLVMDYNGDHIPDLFSEEPAGYRHVWVTAHRNITKVPFPSHQVSPVFVKPCSNGFLDFSGDYDADLVVMSSNKTLQIEFWLNVNGTFKSTDIVPLPSADTLKVVGQLSFIDMDSDGQVDILLPSCTDEDCSNSQLHLYSNNKWQTIPVKLSNGGTVWRFTPPDKSVNQELTQPLQLWVGDFNQDSYPDALTVLYTVNSDKSLSHQVVLLENVPCAPGVKKCPTFGRTFHILWETALNKTEHPVLATFYDIGEDGTMDILIVTKQDGKFNLLAFRNDVAKDNCFIKALVLSSLCTESSTCDYGLVTAGAAVCYNTTTLEGNLEMSCDTQLSKTAHFALQLPYVDFGLGKTPNFVDTMRVGIPSQKTSRSHQWTLIIPNSQLVVYPYPPDQPQKWTNKLFVIPSRLMLLTGIALLGTCAFIALIVGLLHWKEKREDKMEKRQDAHKFHFDAM